MQAYSLEKRYTYADYAQWPDDERWELLCGVPYAMSPAPSQAHQRVLSSLHLIIGAYLKGKSCEVFLPPSDVRFSANTVVQPDLFVVRDKKKLNGMYCDGAPDLVIEILSPSNPAHDTKEKFNLYMDFGVREYWIVDPERKTVSVYLLRDDGYLSPRAYGHEDTVPVNILKGLSIDMREVFPAEAAEAAPATTPEAKESAP